MNHGNLFPPLNPDKPEPFRKPIQDLETRRRLKRWSQSGVSIPCGKYNS